MGSEMCIRDRDTIGVLYGFGNREELEEAGADIIVETPEEILRY